MVCHKQFQNRRRPERLEKKIWREHIWQRQTIADLKQKYGKGKNWVRKTLDQADVQPHQQIKPQFVVAIFDATHFGDDCLLMARAQAIKTNLGWMWIEQETKEVYSLLKGNLETRGLILAAVVLDGRTGIPGVFPVIPVQICHFHQLQTIKRKLTLRPETEAGKELLHIAFGLAKSNEQTMTLDLKNWIEKYQTFIDEKSYAPDSKHWHYTHKRVRSAYRSLIKNLPNLFTYQKYPELNIPNTTNSLDGYWSRVKNLLAAHRGKSQKRIRKIVTEILRKTDCSKGH